jgi:hypothetical protein
MFFMVIFVMKIHICVSQFKKKMGIGKRPKSCKIKKHHKHTNYIFYLYF